MNHKCKNPKFCPICGQKRKEKIIKMFKKHPNIHFSYYDIVEKFDFLNTWQSAQNILEALERKGIIIRSYPKTKRFTTGSGIKVRFKFNSNRFLDLRRFNSKHG